MVRDRLTFTDPPFTGSLEPESFYCGAAQEESLARLEWVVEERQRSCLVLGDAGMGKSHLAAVAARRLGGLGAEVAVLSLRGLPTGDWLDLLLERLPLDPPSRAEPLRAWQKLENRLRENTLMERPTALVFDDVDLGPADAVEGIERLVAAVEPRFARTLVVATASPAGLAAVPAAVRHRAAVRIELMPWGEADVAAFLDHELRRVGGGDDTFSPEAVATLARFAGGVPRTVVTLARLALVAAAGDGATRVDAATVERVWRELAPTWNDERLHDESAAASAAPAAPRFQVVRRLWG
jgi:type II secretory pathway predicted ATPase ExeA